MSEVKKGIFEVIDKESFKYVFIMSLFWSQKYLGESFV
jgi:hypothetical protein